MRRFGHVFCLFCSCSFCRQDIRRFTVKQTDDSAIIDTGLVRSGEQRCKLEIISGKFKGEQTEGVNMLNGSLEQDKMFYPGDTAQVVVSYDGDEILMVTMIDHNRIPM